MTRTGEQIDDYIAPGRCNCCGGLLGRWTPTEIVGAIRAWYDTYGAPPKAQNWNVGTPDHPGIKTIIDVFGSWNNAIKAAGLKTRRWGGSQEVWSDEQMIRALRTWATEHDGEPPTYKDWNRSAPGHPSHRAVVNRFGSWNNALEAAGFCARGPYGVILYPASDPYNTTVDAAPVAEAVRGYIGPHGRAADVAALVQTDPAMIQRLLTGKRTRIQIDAADRICAAIDRPDVFAELMRAAA